MLLANIILAMVAIGVTQASPNAMMAIKSPRKTTFGHPRSSASNRPGAILTYVAITGMPSPITIPEKISPSGSRDNGNGPHVYKMPMAKQAMPINNSSQSVRQTSTKPINEATISIPIIIFSTSLGAKFARPMTLVVV